MSERSFRRAAATAALALALAGTAALGAPRLALGLLVGGLWHLASLGCLAQVLAAWLGPHPSRRRAVLWLLPKIALYGGAFWLIQLPALSALGFGLGFTLVLMTVLAVFAVSAQRLSGKAASGRRLSPAR